MGSVTLVWNSDSPCVRANLEIGFATGPRRQRSTYIRIVRLASSDLRLSAQRALVGQVSPKLYGACVDLREKLVVLTFYVAPDLSTDERDDLTVAGTAVIADFPDDHLVREDLIAVEDPREPLRTEGTWVLLQRGFLTVEG